MSEQAATAPATARARRRDLVLRGVAWALLACGVTIGVTIAVAGEREMSVTSLQSAIDDGRVNEITVEGSLDGGVAHWQGRLVDRVTDLNDGPRLRLGDVHVTSVDGPRSRGEIGGWAVPGWVGPLGIMLFVAVLCLLVLGPQPWRATRWAWFWVLALAPPLGMLAFLLLGGSTGRWPPARPSRRLTGGRAFALAFAINIVLSVLARVVL